MPSQGTHPCEADHEGAVVAIVSGPPWLGCGEQGLDVSAHCIEVNGLEGRLIKGQRPARGLPGRVNVCSGGRGVSTVALHARTVPACTALAHTITRVRISAAAAPTALPALPMALSN